MNKYVLRWQIGQFIHRSIKAIQMKAIQISRPWFTKIQKSPNKIISQYRIHLRDTMGVDVTILQSFTRFLLFVNDSRASGKTLGSRWRRHVTNILEQQPKRNTEREKEREKEREREREREEKK